MGMEVMFGRFVLLCIVPSPREDMETDMSKNPRKKIIKSFIVSYILLVI